MKHDREIKVLWAKRDRISAGPFRSHVTVMLQVSEEAPHLEVLKTRIETMVEMEALLRELQLVAADDRQGGTLFECPICGADRLTDRTVRHEDRCRIGVVLKRIDEANR